MEKRRYFIVGTDTGVGKTYISASLLRFHNKSNCSSLGLKPIATGGFRCGATVLNPDALLLMEYSNIKLPYHDINPFSFLPPVSPNIASKKLTVSRICSKVFPILELHRNAGLIIIEGAGGFYTPLNERETMADFAKAIAFPIILVVRIGLGCLNSAILTYEAIKRRKLKTAGWIYNLIPDGVMNNTKMATAIQNIETLQNYIDAPMINFMY